MWFSGESLGVFRVIVTELEICYIYKVVILIIKIVAHNLSGATDFFSII
jgi:hypothetical protein